MRKARPWLLAALPVVAIVLGLTLGLRSGDDGHELVSGVAVSQAAERTEGRGSARIAMDVSVDSVVNGQPVSIEMSGEGIEDFRHQVGTLSLQLAMPGQTAGALGEQMKFEETFDHLVIYMRSPLFEPSLPEGKDWISMDLRSVGEAQGVDFQQLSSLGGNGSPTQMLDQLRAVSSSIERVGEEDVRGVSTTHYKATIDLDRYPSLAKPKDQAEIRASVRAVEDLSGSSRFPTEIWIDGDHLVRRLQTTFEAQNPAIDQTMSFTMTMEFFEFGTPVSVQPPSASETISAEDLLGSASYRRALQGQAPASGSAG